MNATVLELIIKKFVVEHHLSSAEMSQIKVEAYAPMLDTVASDLVARVTRYIPTHCLEKYEFRAPLTWWDAFKQRWFPLWLARRFPWKYRVEVVEPAKLFLGLEIPKEWKENSLNHCFVQKFERMGL